MSNRLRVDGLRYWPELNGMQIRAIRLRATPIRGTWLRGYHWLNTVFGVSRLILDPRRQ